MNSQNKDDTKCDYWRYCGVDGNQALAAAAAPICPAGATASTTSWVGTCINPDDNRPI